MSISHFHRSWPAKLFLFRIASRFWWLRNGITTVRNMWGTTEALALKRRIEAGVVLGPTIYTTGPVTDGEPPIFPGSRAVATTAEAAKAVAADKEAGYEAIKAYQRLSAPVYTALVRAAHQQGLPVYGHVPRDVGLMAAIQAGQRSIEHVDGFQFVLQADDSPFRHKAPANGTEARRLWEHIDLSKLPDIVGAIRAARTWNCPTIIVSQRAATAPDEVAGEQQRPAMKYVPAGLLKAWLPNQDFRSSQLQREDFTLLRKRAEIAKRITKALNDGGAGLLLGTDFANPWVVPGFSIHEELENLVDSGLSSYEAIRAGTSAAAAFLDKATEFGQVKVGLRADLLLVDANPLESVANLRRRSGVLVRGRWLSESELQGRLREAARTASSFGN